MRSDGGRITSGVLLILLVASTIWVALTVTAPLLAPSDTLLDLTGTVGMRENIAQFESLSIVPRTIYIIGDIECHQIAERSYFLNGNQMPFCSRDIGLFLGIALGFGIATFFFLQLNPMWLLVGLVPIGLDGGLQLVTAYESTNALRLVTGMVGGAVLALLIASFVLAFREDAKRTTSSEQEMFQENMDKSLDGGVEDRSDEADQ
ncbi:MAG TPA: DUF2085 domain-containing protein [Thermoplasmata archaeon]|nr:DUF2085 domain-containing protein [Thermoplasmata archaeon]